MLVVISKLKYWALLRFTTGVAKVEHCIDANYLFCWILL